MDDVDDILSLDTGDGAETARGSARRSATTVVTPVASTSQSSSMVTTGFPKPRSRRSSIESTPSTAADSISKPKYGRRAMKAPQAEATPFGNILDSSPPASLDASVWNAETRIGDDDRRSQKSGDTFNVQSGRRSSNTRTIEDLEDNQVTQFIPDLKNIKRDELAATSADAPIVSTSRLMSYQDLARDLSSRSSSVPTTLDDIDISLLHRFLQSEKACREPDTLWSWSNLIADISSNTAAS